MNSRTLSTTAIVGCLLLGVCLVALRHHRIEQAKSAREETRWLLVYQADFEAVLSTPQEYAQVRFALPFNTRHCEVTNLDTQPWNVSSPHLIAEEKVRPNTGTRVLRLTARQSGTYRVSAKFQLRLSPQSDWKLKPALESLTPEQRQFFLGPEENIPGPGQMRSVRDARDAIAGEGGTTSKLVQGVFDYCSGIDSTPEGASDEVDVALTKMQGTPKARARAMVALCRALGIPARMVAGFRIQQGANIPTQIWVEVFLEDLKSWVPFDPTTGWSWNLPLDYLPAWRGGEQIYSATKNVSSLAPVYSIKRLPPTSQVLRGEVDHPLQILNLTRMPLSMHRVMKILLLLPFAALITAVIRNVVGVQTFGTFGPALLAMSFIYAEWKTGLLILVTVVTIGLFGRSALERLRLLMVPRLCIILTVVILCVVFSLSTLYYLLHLASAQAVLLPMVIMTMLIERFHVTVDEDGLVYAIQLAIGTLAVGLLCYLVLGWDKVGAWVLTYPEAHFFTIAAFILLGRYAGYRLTELWRFRDLVEPSEPIR